MLIWEVETDADKTRNKEALAVENDALKDEFT